MDLSEPGPRFSDFSIGNDVTASSEMKLTDVTVNVFASNGKRSVHGFACVKGGRRGCGVHRGSHSQKKKVSWHTSDYYNDHVLIIC